VIEINKLSPAALKAAVRTGIAEWGQRASIFEHALYVEPQDARRGHYRKCWCGCGRKAKFRLMANGICMSEGCELSMHREAKGRSSRSTRDGENG